MNNFVPASLSSASLSAAMHISNFQAMHLSDSQIDDHLIGDLAPVAAAHLAACELCESRVALARAPIAGFDSVTLAWSERRSATLPIERFAPRELSLYQRLAWGASMAAALTVGIAIPVANNQARQQAAALATDMVATDMTPAVPASEAQISNDNRMLQAIDTELNASVESPQGLGLEPVSTSFHSASPSSLQATSSLQD